MGEEFSHYSMGAWLWVSELLSVAYYSLIGGGCGVGFGGQETLCEVGYVRVKQVGLD
jgi:hypothetical protein